MEVELGTPDRGVPSRRSAGDGFSDFYRRELGVQVRRAALLSGSSDVANDIVHDVMIEVYQRWDRLDQPGAYLNRAVVNRCRDHQRRQFRRARVLSLLGFGEPVVDPVEVLDDALERLPFNQRAALVLRYYNGLTKDEIAAVLGCASGSVGPWIDRGLKTLRRSLG